MKWILVTVAAAYANGLFAAYLAEQGYKEYPDFFGGAAMIMVIALVPMVAAYAEKRLGK